MAPFSPARSIGNALDLLIGIINPRAGLIRSATRSAMYAAAKSPRTIGDWSPVDSSINDIISNSSKPVRARIRQLVRDFPYFARANTVLCDYVVGAGIVFQSAIRQQESFNRQAITATEDAFNRWADEADASGRLHLYEMMNLAKRQENENGEFFLIVRQIKDPSRFLPLAFQLYESDWLDSTSAKAEAGASIHQGVEFDPSTGRAIAYHFTDPDGWGKTIRVPAELVIHGFRTLRPGQLRGISDFAPGVLVAKDLSTYMDAEIDAAKMAAKYLAMVETPDIAGRMAALTTDDANQKIDSLENAIIEYLRPGEKITLASNPRPGGNFPPMVRLILTMLSVTTGCPYELLSGDYTGMNYSTLRIGRNDFMQGLRPAITRHVRSFCKPVASRFFDAAVLAGKLRMPGYWADPAPWQRCTWQPPGMESIDIARETKSLIDQVQSGLRSPQEIALARGRDLEEIYSEIKEAKDMAEEMGLEFNLDSISTALANSPSAIEGQGIKEGSDDETEETA
jgi:lambda family phage portal protein